MARLYPVYTQDETVTPKDATKQPRAPRPRQNCQPKMAAQKLLAPNCIQNRQFQNTRNGAIPSQNAGGHCPATLPQPNRKRHVKHRVLHRPLKLLPAPATVVQKTADCRQPYGLVKKLMMSRRLDAKHGAFYLLQHTRIGQPPQSGHIYSLAACATRALTGEFPLSTCKKWGQAQCSRPGPHFSLPKVSGYSKNPSTSLLRKTALK